LLKVTKEENRAKKTRIMQRAYLDWRNFQRYFDFLLEGGFIANCDSNSYELTEKGEELIKRLNQVDEMLNQKFKKISLDKCYINFYQYTLLYLWLNFSLEKNLNICFYYMLLLYAF